MKSYRVIHVPSSVGGNPQTLSQALKSLGIDSRSLVVSQNYFAYKADLTLHHPGQSLIFREIKRLFAVLFYLPSFDIVHYNAGTTLACPYAFDPALYKTFRALNPLRYFFSAYRRLLQLLEIYLLRTLGKIIFITYQGDDARQGDFSLMHFNISIASQVEEGYYSPKSDAFKRKTIKMLASVSEQVYSVNPDLLYVLPEKTKFVPYSHIFIGDWHPKYTQLENRPLKIIHAPSHRKVKGTDLILSALASLHNQNYEFELILVEGLSNSEARKIYETGDILVDQIFAGWYGGLAVEFMALGKPVAVYIRDEDLTFIPDEMKKELPVIRVTPDTLESDLRKILEMPRQKLLDLAKKSRGFVEKWHDPIKIASEIKQDYDQAYEKKSKILR